jgi:hypothetical protein
MEDRRLHRPPHSKKRRKEKGERKGFDFNGREADRTTNQFAGRDKSGPLGEGTIIDISRQIIVGN